MDLPHPIHNSTTPSGTGTPLFFNLRAHYQKSLGHTANQRLELRFAQNTSNQKWMIAGREISGTGSPWEYSNLQSKALFNIYLALHLLRFSLLRCSMEGAALLFSAVILNDEEPLCLYGLMLSPSTNEWWSAVPPASFAPVQEFSRFESFLWSRASKMGAKRLRTIDDYREICGLKALQRKGVIHYYYGVVGTLRTSVPLVTVWLLWYELNIPASHKRKYHNESTMRT